MVLAKARRGSIENDPIVVLAEQIPLQVVGLIRELATLRREHPEATPISPQQNARPDIVFAQAVDDFDRWQAGIGSDNCTRGVAQELRKLSARYEHVFDSAPNFATLWKCCDAGPCRLFTRKGLQLKTCGEAAEVFGAYRDKSVSEAALFHYQVSLMLGTNWSDILQARLSPYCRYRSIF